LEPGEYASFKQVTEAGGKVKKGEKGHIVVFWTWLENEDDNGEMTKIPYLRYYTVFEVSKQCEGYKVNERSRALNMIRLRKQSGFAMAIRMRR